MERLPPWDPGVWSAGARAPEPALQIDARAGRHDGYDRLVLSFRDRVPGYTVRYVDGTVHECGSGRPVDAPHAAALRIELRPAAAHDEHGAPSVRDRSIEPSLPVIRTARITCDFEGRVEWVVGLTERTALRVFSLDSPARLVVDLRH